MMTQSQTYNLMSVTEQYAAARNDDPVTYNLMSVTVQHASARNDDPIANIQLDVSDSISYCS